MRPYVVDRIVPPNGVVVTRTKPRELEQRDQAATAAELNAMMEAVVTGGTGTAAQIPGVRGGRQDGNRRDPGVSGINTTWFIAFAPADQPRVAIAVVLQNQTGFRRLRPPLRSRRQVMQALLSRP